MSVIHLVRNVEDYTSLHGLFHFHYLQSFVINKQLLNNNNKVSTKEKKSLFNKGRDERFTCYRIEFRTITITAE